MAPRPTRSFRNVKRRDHTPRRYRHAWSGPALALELPVTVTSMATAEAPTQLQPKTIRPSRIRTTVVRSRQSYRRALGSLALVLVLALI